MLESLFNKDADLKACDFIQKRLQHSCFSMNIGKFLRTPILKNICEWLLLTRASFRSSHLELFYQKGVPRNFAKLTGKHLCQSLLSVKLQAQACNFIKKETLAQVFSCEFCESFQNTFFMKHLWWLLLNISHWCLSQLLLIHFITIENLW